METILNVQHNSALNTNMFPFTQKCIKHFISTFIFEIQSYVNNWNIHYPVYATR